MTGAAFGGSPLPLDQLDQDLPRRPGVEERHQVAPGPWAGLGVDEVEALLGEPLQLPTDVGGAVGDVVEARTPALEEATHGGVGGEGLEEFQLPHEADADTLLGKGLDGGTRGAAQAFVKRPRLLDGGDGDGDVIDNQTVHGHFQDGERRLPEPSIGFGLEGIQGE